MKAEIRTEDGCRRVVEFEVPPDEMEKHYEDVATGFRRHAKVKGFRPGKAPKDLVERRYAEGIAEEVRDQTTNRVFGSWARDAGLEIVALRGFDDVRWDRGDPLTFTAEVEVAPEVPLVAYQGIEVEKPSADVADDDVEQAVEELRGRQATFELASDRPLQMGDYAVVNYTGIVEGKPIAELDAEANALSEANRQWLEISDTGFLPGFASQVVGMTTGDRRQADVDIPAEFGRPLLAGKKATFFVELLEIRERVPPPLDDDLARGYEAQDLDDWRAKIREALAAQRTIRADREVRRQVIERLLAGAEFPVPPALLSQETRRAIYDMVLESQQRGVSREVIEERKEELFGHASRSAEQRLRLSYILRRIADEEKIDVTDDDVEERIGRMAEMAEAEPVKVRKDLEKRGVMDDLRDEIRESKALEFVISGAKVTAS